MLQLPVLGYAIPRKQTKIVSTRLHAEATLNFLSRRNKKQHYVGVALCPDGLGIAVLSKDSSGRDLLVLEHAAHVNCDAQDYHTHLKQMVADLDLASAACIAVMPRGSYSLIQTELPAVPANELQDAVRWQIRDLLEFPAADAVIETIQFDDTANGRSLSFAIAAQRHKVQEVVDVVHDSAGLNLRAIDIPELSLRALLRAVEGSEQGLALLILWKTTGLVAITRGDELCMARKVDIGIDALLNAADPAPESGVEISMAQQELLDEAILNIQRSLDFYESNVARRPVRKVLIAPLGVSLPGLVEYLDTYLNPAVAFLDLSQILQHKPAHEHHAEQTFSQITPCVLPAVSAAMRALEMQL